MNLKIVEYVNTAIEVQRTIINLTIADFDTGAGAVMKNVIEGKGELLVGSAAGIVDNLPVAANGKVLVTDSAEPLGVKWGDAAGGGSPYITYDVDGGSIGATKTNGCAYGNYETVDNQNNYQAAIFDPAAIKYGEFSIATPDDWDAGTFLAEYDLIGLAYIIDPCDAVWTAGTANVTASTETTIKREGTGSAKAVVNATFTTGVALYKAITSVNLTGATRVCGWIRSTINQGAGDLRLLLDDTAACASPVKELLLPALTADTWAWFDLDAGDMSGCTAIISVGIKINNDLGAFTFYVDEVGCYGATVLAIQALAHADTDNWDMAYGSAQSLTITPKPKQITVSPETAAITAGNSPAAGDVLHFRVYRNSTNASDLHPGWLGIYKLRLKLTRAA